MLKIINESTGKTALTIQDNGDLQIDGDVIVTEEVEVKAAFEKAKEE